MTNHESARLKLSVAIPGSLIADTPHLREKTAKLGALARACSIFGVHEIILYPDDAQRNQKSELELCTKILDFLETPQYLRKRLFGLDSSLKYVGILPPLQIPPHNVPRSTSQSKENDFREGVVIGRRGGILTVDVGLERTIECRGDIRPGTRVTVQLTSLGTNIVGEIVEPSKISIYWGYRVRQAKFKLGKLLEDGFTLKIGTSRYGTDVRKVWSQLSESLKDVESVLITFGSPHLGLTEILKEEGKSPDASFDFFINTIPEQQVATVRTEEAVIASLELLNLMRKV